MKTIKTFSTVLLMAFQQFFWYLAEAITMIILAVILIRNKSLLLIK